MIKLMSLIQGVTINRSKKDSWRWFLDEDCKFTVKGLKRLVDVKVLGAHGSIIEIDGTNSFRER